MTDRVRFEGTSYGVAVAFEVPVELVDEAAGQLPYGWTHGIDREPRLWQLAPIDNGYGLWCDDEPAYAASTAAEGLNALMSFLELWVAEHAEGRIFVHAGVAALDGRAIVLPGRTLAGKSTLTAALVRAGATYYSDEYAVLDADGQVWPYARPLSIRPETGGIGTPTPVEHFGGTPATEHARMGLVARLQYEQGAPFAVEGLTRGQAVLELLDNTIPARTRPVEVMDVLAAATTTVRGVKGTRGDADEAAAQLIMLLRESGIE